MTPVKGLHKLVTLAFISVTYFCFENKLVWKLTHSLPPFNTYFSFYHCCKSYLFWTATSLVFLKLNDIVLWYEKKIFLDSKKFHCLCWVVFQVWPPIHTPHCNESCL